MPTVEAPGAIAIGQTLTLTLRNSKAPQDCYILQNSIMLPEVLTLQPDEPLVYFPEAPGHYAIRGTDFETSFEVTTDIQINSGPVCERQMWFPSAWIAAVDNNHESMVAALLPELIHPGSVIYDIGANIGLYARPFLELAGEAGYVYCFEPNPVALHYLSHNLALSGSGNYLILPLAISDRNAPTSLVLNADNHALASMVAAKRGINISVKGIALDEAISRFELRLPDLIKMDIEGGEIVAIKGMIETIKRCQPTLIFELHGQLAARETLRYLDAYRWQIAGETRSHSARELAATFPEACLQVIGRISN